MNATSSMTSIPRMNMYNLNVPSSGGDGNLTLPQSGSNTPRTPEVLNTLMAVMNPLDAYTPTDPKLACSPPGDSAIGSGTGSIPGNGSMAGLPPVLSVQKNRSLLIKEGLKLTIQAKRGSGSSVSSGSEPAVEGQEKPQPFHKEEFTMDSIGSDDGDDGMSSIGGDGILSLEDEERRKRRREKNKIAATKCRLKKRARTVKLEEESKLLENQNVDLKAEIEKLRSERQHLVEMLSGHQKHCKKNHRMGPYPEEDFTNPSAPEFISTDLATTAFPPSEEPLPNPLTAPPVPLDYQKLPRKIGDNARKPEVSVPSTSQYSMDSYPPPPPTNFPADVTPVRQDYYPNTEVPMYDFTPDVKPALGLLPGPPSYYARSNYDCQSASFPQYQSPYPQSDYDSNVELISPSSTATSGFTDYSTSDASSFSHFPVPPTPSPVVDEYSQPNPRYNCCVYEINH